MNSKATSYAFLFGAIYFTCMALAHFYSIKLPMLFIYYDVPFYAYQDQIIAFALTAYSALFYLASERRENAPAALIVLAITFAGLASVNFSYDLNSLLTNGQKPDIYWLQTLSLNIYWFVLLGLYMRDGKAIKKK